MVKNTKLWNLLFAFFVLIIFTGTGMAEVNIDTTLVTNIGYETNSGVRYDHINSIDLNKASPDVQPGDILKIDIDVLSGPTIDVKFRAWGCRDYTDQNGGLHTNCDYPASGDPEYFNIKDISFTKKISGPIEGPLEVLLIGKSDDTRVHVKITSSSPAKPTPIIPTPVETNPPKAVGFEAFESLLVVFAMVILANFKNNF